jgi:hypothetical protein
VQGYDIIGDVHGCSTELEALLTELDYRQSDWTGAYTHPQRQAIFVGDLIDRGPDQLRVLDTVKRMVDVGSAQVVMGNHEFNAIAYATEHPARPGQFLRSHSSKNYDQHQAFLIQVTGSEREHYLQWFKTMPLWLDLDGMRVIHACWHEESMRVVESALGANRFTALDQFVRATTKGDPLYDAIEVLLKGPEVSLVDHHQPPYLDKDNHLREKARIRWWRDGGWTLREIALLDGNFTTEDGSPYPELPDIAVLADVAAYAYSGTAPVFYGHYWRRGTPQHLDDWTGRTACLDFSAVKGGTLFAYRWSGEDQVCAENFVAHSGGA